MLIVDRAVGNYLNGGTNNGQAYGFKLEFLSKIPATKSSVNTASTLMHWLVRTASAKHGVKDLCTPLLPVHAASTSKRLAARDNSV